MSNRSQARPVIVPVPADPAFVQAKFDEMLEHQAEWSSDRREALAMKYATYVPQADTIYECDDKCGSFWQQLPVAPLGRDSKASDLRIP